MGSFIDRGNVQKRRCGIRRPPQVKAVQQFDHLFRAGPGPVQIPAVAIVAGQLIIEGEGGAVMLLLIGEAGHFLQVGAGLPGLIGLKQKICLMKYIVGIH